jgi:pyruvate,orthophosphate dikinase
VVAGIRTPVPISRLNELNHEVCSELLRNVEILESNYHDMQDIEFTVQGNTAIITIE